MIKSNCFIHTSYYYNILNYNFFVINKNFEKSSMEFFEKIEEYEAKVFIIIYSEKPSGFGMKSTWQTKFNNFCLS